MLIHLSPLQARVIGVLIEKEITTPEQYPLSLNALTLGCNQKSSRDPVMQLSESDVQNVLDELNEMKLLFEYQGSGSRVIKYKHRFCNTEFSSLKFTPQQLSIICVLLLRGPQTPGELRTRTNRLAEFANVNEVESCLQELSDFNGEKLVVKLAREPGKREARYVQMFSENAELTESKNDIRDSDSGTSSAQVKPFAANDSSQTLDEALARIEALESQIASLSKRMEDMQETIDILSS